jgi:hypothetical protein
MPLHSQAVRWEKVYVFISSTFGDMHAERDYLVKRVFPELQDWCERRRLRLVDIDLRWGVTEADTTSKRAVEVCLERINDCRPFFLCFLGQRHGWVPKETDIAKDTFKKFPALREALGAASVTELEIRHAILQPFPFPQHEDTKHAAPQPAEHAFFYVREAGYLRQLHAAPRQLLCTFTDDVGPDDETDEEREQRERARVALQTLREATIPQDRRVLYQADWHAELATPELAMPLECTGEWRRKWNRFAHLDLADTDERIPAEKLAAANKYNAALTRGRLSQFRSLAPAREKFAPDTELAQIIQHDLQQAIQTRFPTHTEVVQQTEQQKELDQQEGFLQACSEGFIERTGDFDPLDAYVADDSNKLCVLTAAGGMGKSTLLAKWIDRARTQLEAQPALHFRFIGASDRSTTVYSLLRSLLSEMLTAKTLDLEIPPDPNKLREALPELLAAIGKSGKTVIVLDALNQLESGLQDLHWLPRTLPNNIKLIVSFKRDDDASEQLYQHFQAAQSTLIEVPPFAELEDRRKLVRAYLQQYLKELDEAHLATLIATAGASNPLYLKVVLSELRVFGAHAGLAEKIRRDFGDNPITAFQGVLQRLASDPAYAPIASQRAVPLLFGLLAHARHGLSVEELTSLFVQALGLEDNEQGRQAAADTINLLLRQVRPFLARREGRYDYFYESFKLAAQQHCAISEEEPSATGWSAPQFHQLLAGLFSRQADPSGNRQWDGDSPRALRDLPYHLLEGKQSEELFRVAREEVFLTAQKRSFPDEPELYLQTIQSAIEGAARIDDAARMAEFVLAHARQVVEASQESPLDALRSGQLARAWKLADLYDSERCVLWHLLLAWELKDEGKLDDGRATLERIEKKELPQLSYGEIPANGIIVMKDWRSRSAVEMLAQAFDMDVDLASLLCNKLLEDAALSELSYKLADRRQFVAAIATAKNIMDLFDRSKTFCEVVTKQMKAGELVAALSTAQQIEHEYDRTNALREIAVTQAQAGDIVAALTSAELVTDSDKQIILMQVAITQAQSKNYTAAIETTQQLHLFGDRLQILWVIAVEQARGGYFSEAFTTVQQISDVKRKALTLCDIAVEQAKAGFVKAANETFNEAFETSLQIDIKERFKSLVAIIEAQTLSGYGDEALDTVQRFSAPIDRAMMLSVIGAALMRAGHINRASYIFAQALTVARQIESVSDQLAAIEEITKSQAESGDLTATLNLAGQEKFTTARVELLRTIAKVQAEKGNQEASRLSLREAASTAQQIEKGGFRVRSLLEIAIEQSHVGDEQASNDSFGEALSTTHQLEDIYDKFRNLLEIAKALKHLGGQDLSKKIFAAALAAARQIEHAREGYLCDIAIAQIQNGENSLSRKTFAELLTLKQQSDSAPGLVEALEDIAAVLAQVGYSEFAVRTEELVENVADKAKVLCAVACVQAQAGNIIAALETAELIDDLQDQAAQAYRGWEESHDKNILAMKAMGAAFGDLISVSDTRVIALCKIAAAQARAGDSANALARAIQITRTDHKVRILCDIALAEAQMGDQVSSRKTLDIALAEAEAEAEVSTWGSVYLRNIATAQAQSGDTTTGIEIAHRINDSYQKVLAMCAIAVSEAKNGDITLARRTFAKTLKIARTLKSPKSIWEKDNISIWLGALQRIAIAQAQAGDIEAALVTARRIHNTTFGQETPEWIEALQEIAAAQAQKGDSAAALETVQQIGRAEWKAKVISAIAASQAQPNVTQAALHNASTILTERDKHLPEISAAFVRAGNKEGLKRMMVPNAYYLEAAHRTCGFLARAYPEQSLAVASLLVTNAQRS